MKRIGIYTLLIIILSNFSLIAQDRKLVSGTNGMAATAHPLATKAAIEILKKGGNAIDAAVAAAFTIGVVEPDGSGIGGGGGMVIYLKNKKKSYYINYYVRASANAPLTFDSKKQRHTGTAVCVPGTVAGLTLAHKKFGKLPLSEVLKPAIKVAKNGFAIDATLGTLILENTTTLSEDSAASSIFLEEGFPRMEGDIIVQKDLAKTLQAISDKGRDGFYKGAVAQGMVDGLKKIGGTITLNDLANYKAKLSEPLKGNYRGLEVLTTVAPQAGASIIQGLNMLENYDFKKAGHFTKNAQSAHVMAETFRKVYTDRFYFLGDPDFINPPVYGLISPQYAKVRYKAINMNAPVPKSYRETEKGNPLKYQNKKHKKRQWKNSNNDTDDGGEDDKHNKNDNPIDEFSNPIDINTYQDVEYDGSTTHLSVVDKDGNAVSLTQTLGTFFGSGKIVEGVLFNCGMSNFSNSENPNKIERSKQPRSSISPTIVLKNGNPFIVVGTPGGSRIIATVLQMIVNVVDFDMDVEEANQSPRIYTQKFVDHLHVESDVDKKVVEKLRKMGHDVQVHEGKDLFFGGVQMIVIDPVTNKLYGSADIRRGGIAEGY